MMKSFGWVRACGGLPIALVALALVAARADQAKATTAAPRNNIGTPERIGAARPLALALYGDTFTQRQKLTADLADVNQSISRGESQLSDLNDKLLGANIALGLAQAALDKATKDGNGGAQIAATILIAGIQRGIDDLNDKKADVQSDLKANRARRNQLKDELSRLGSL